MGSNIRRANPGMIIQPCNLGFYMLPQFSNVWPKLVIVEEIMGSGKSLTTLNIAHRLEASGRGGPGCLNRFSASISGASAGVRLPSGGAAG